MSALKSLTRKWGLYGLTLLVSLGAHLVLVLGLGSAATRQPAERQRRVEIALVEPEPPPKPEPAPEPEPPPKPQPKPEPVERPDPKPAPQQDVEAAQPPPEEPPPPPNSKQANEPAQDAKPVFGITMESTVGPEDSGNFQVRVGNTLMQEPEAEVTNPEDVKSYAPVPVHEVSELPRVRKEFKPEYPPQAKAEGLEGKVKLRVDVLADGSVGDVSVIDGLGPALDKNAIAAMKKFRFDPATRKGEAVATTITYVLTYVIEE